MKKMAVLLSLFLIAAPVLRAQEEEPDFTPEAQRVVDRGLYALTQLQAADGSFGASFRVANTALAGLAFLAAGHVPGRGPYSGVILKCVRYLVDSSRDGYIKDVSPGQEKGMYGHGYAMLFLSQVHGMIPPEEEAFSRRIREVLVQAVRVSESAQTNGGWGYEPGIGEDEGSITATQTQALRAVHDMGIAVSAETIRKAVEYMNETTSPDGMTAYQRGKPDQRTPTLTAIGLCVLTHLGQYDDPKIKKGLEYLLERYKPGQGANRPVRNSWTEWWYFYGNYYATQAMHQAGGRYWREWWPAVRDSLMASQSSTGLWSVAESEQYGSAFGTSLALITLQIPRGYLPIFQQTAKDK